MVREEYKDLINYVSYRTGESYNRAWLVIKEYSDVLKEALKRGDTVLVEGLVKISFTTTEGYIYNNKEFGLERQVSEIEERLEIPKVDIKSIITVYINRIKDRVLEGYQVNLKGICYLLPKEQGEDIICTPRVSPVLEKPELADFVVTTDNGLLVMELKDKDLRFKINIVSDLEFLEGYVEEDRGKLDIPHIDI